jgi:hypothetical protein
MHPTKEQEVCMKFCINHGNSRMRTLTMTKLHQDKTIISQWIHQDPKMWDRWRAKPRACVVLWDIEKIIHKEFIVTDQTINSTYYCDVLRWLHENVRRIRPELWWQKSWLLHHNNALAFTREHFIKNNMSSPTHPTHLICPFVTFLFPQLKTTQFSHNWDNPGRIVDGVEHPHRTWLPGCT